MKICGKCKKELPFANFGRLKSSKDGYRRVCKLCRKQEYVANSYANIKRTKEYYSKNRESIREKARLTRQTDGYKAGYRQYIKRRQSTDPLFKMAGVIRRRIHKALIAAEWLRTAEFHSYIGCNRETLVKHIESRFQSGMTWENHGEWHLDHIIPLASAENIDELYKLSHYTNLQPLWASDNLQKGVKIIRSEDIV